MEVREVDHRYPERGSPSEDFQLCVDRYDCTLRDLVRHLARIAAESDYEAFQNSCDYGSMGHEQKEPRP
jgi:hypothetical protein